MGVSLPAPSMVIPSGTRPVRGGTPLHVGSNVVVVLVDVELVGAVVDVDSMVVIVVVLLGADVDESFEQAAATTAMAASAWGHDLMAGLDPSSIAGPDTPTTFPPTASTHCHLPTPSQSDITSRRTDATEVTFGLWATDRR